MWVLVVPHSIYYGNYSKIITAEGKKNISYTNRIKFFFKLFWYEHMPLPSLTTKMHIKTLFKLFNKTHVHGTKGFFFIPYLGKRESALEIYILLSVIPFKSSVLFKVSIPHLITGCR